MLVYDFRFKHIHTPFVSIFAGSWIEATAPSKPLLQGCLYYTCTEDCTSLLRPVIISLKEALLKVKVTDEKWNTQVSVSAYFKIS